MKSARFLFLFLFICLLTESGVRAQDPKLVELRNAFAQKYLEPDAHFALAKYYLEQRNALQAFTILEYARRYRFEEKDFDEAYFRFFGDPMPEPPDAAKNHFAAGSKFLSEQKYDEAEQHFLKANQIYDRSFFINAWIGRFYLKARSDSTKALPFYYKAYFLYPHAYETEFAESRIRAIAFAAAENSFKADLNSGKSLQELSGSSDPVIAGLAIARMAASWDPKYLSSIVMATNSDDSSNRWGAFLIIQKYAGTSLDRIVDEMHSSPDLRRRGLSAYAIVKRPGPKKFEVLEKMLSEAADLVRFDAVSALVQEGGPTSRKLLVEHAQREKQVRLRKLIDASMKQNSR